MPPIGSRDAQTVLAGGGRAHAPRIAGVQIHELGNIITRSGLMSEIFRTDWSVVGIAVRQVNWVQLDPGKVTDWHFHTRQTDHLVAVSGNIKLALYDGREGSATQGASEIVRMGVARPVLTVVPPGVWHGLRNESGGPAGYLNMVNELYIYENPDNWRLTPGSSDIPDIL